MNIGFIKEIIESMFQFERLDALSKKSSVVAIVHAELVCNINYALLDQPGTREVLIGEATPTIDIGGRHFEYDLESRLAAIAQAFRHSAVKLDQVITAETLADIMGALDFLPDILRSVIPR